MAQTLTRLLVHAIFSTKGRQDLIPPEIESELHAYLAGICRNCGSPLLTAGGTANHVHLLISLSKTIALSDLMLNVKKDSSRWLKTKAPGLERFGWQDGYGAFSIGQSQAAAVTAYIARQKEKHRAMSFEAEFIALLKKYNVPYDPRYVWSDEHGV